MGGNYNYSIIGRIYCLNDSIVDFITTSPLYMTKTGIVQLSNYTWIIYFAWTPTSNQTGKVVCHCKRIVRRSFSILGLQPFCVAAIDNNGQSSSQYCVTWVVGGNNPGIIAPTFIQSSASPVGTVLATQSRFSIQSKDLSVISFTSKAYRLQLIYTLTIICLFYSNITPYENNTKPNFY